MKLGRLPKKFNPKTLKLSKYLESPLVTAPPPPPEKVWREYKVPSDQWGMFGNDTIGDCTCACIAHMLMLVTAHTGTMIVPSESDVITAYSAVSGYDPSTGANDNGAAITDVLNYWQTNGISGHKILGWAEIDYTNIDQIKQAIWLFGGVDLGVNIAQAAMEQFSAGQSWEVVPDDGGIEGGHSIPNFGYGSDGTNCITWAQRQAMSWVWFAKYVEEAYAVITQDWIVQATQETPSGFDLATLQTDLAYIQQQA